MADNGISPPRSPTAPPRAEGILGHRDMARAEIVRQTRSVETGFLWKDEMGWDGMARHVRNGSRIAQS